MTTVRAAGLEARITKVRRGWAVEPKLVDLDTGVVQSDPSAGRARWTSRRNMITKIMTARTSISGS